MKSSSMSVSDTPALSAVWMAVDVPDATFGMLMLSVPGGSGCELARLAYARPARASSMNWDMSHSGGTK